MLFSKMFGFVVIVIISLFGENFIAKVAKYGSHFLQYLFSTLMVTVKRINFFFVNKTKKKIMTMRAKIENN